MRKLFSSTLLMLILIGILSLTFNILKVNADKSFAIQRDGSIYPPTTKMVTSDNIVYTLIGDITFDADVYIAIEVKKDNIVIDGAGYTLYGSGSNVGIELSSRHNVTIKNINIKNFQIGITINRYSYYNIISGNNISDNEIYGITIGNSFNNTITENQIAYNGEGIGLFDAPYDNMFYHNNFIENNKHISFTSESIGNENIWDNGYPSGGNYWDEYQEKYPYASERDDSDIWDTAYILDDNNADYYPLTNPWSISSAPPPPIGPSTEPTTTPEPSSSPEPTTTSEPSSTPGPTPTPEQQPEQPRGIPGFNTTSVIIGLLIGVIIIWLLRKQK